MAKRIQAVAVACKVVDRMVLERTFAVAGIHILAFAVGIGIADLDNWVVVLAVDSGKM